MVRPYIYIDRVGKLKGLIPVLLNRQLVHYKRNPGL